MIFIEQDGVRWQCRPEFAPHLHEVLLTPARVIKESPAKLVTAHTTSQWTCFVKRYRTAAVPGRSLKYFFKKSQAAAEWNTALRLEEMGIATVRHLAFGERRSAFGLLESILITEGFAGHSLLEADLRDPGNFYAFLEKMYAARIFQKDLHPSNLLIHPASGEVRLVDVDGIQFDREVTAAEKNRVLAFLRIFLDLPVSAEVERLTAEIRRDIFAERARRALRHNRDFAPRRIGGRVWHARTSLMTAEAVAVMEDVGGFLAGRARLFKNGRTSTVGAGETVVLKRFNFRKWINLVKDWFRPSRAKRAFRKAYHLELAGVRTARAIAAADERVCGFLWRSYLLMELIPGAVDARFWKGDRNLARREMARLIARMHEAGLAHRDLKESNILFNETGQACLIDLEGLEFVGRVTAQRALSDLRRLEEGAGRIPDFSPRDRSSFLREYCRVRRLNPRTLFGRGA